MAQKIIKIGNKECVYDLPSKSDTTKYIIQAYNETSKQLSYYSVTTEMEEWVFVADDDDCVIITIYGTTDNGKVLNKDCYKKPALGEIEKQSSEPDLGMIENQLDGLDRINCKVEEMVPSPNVSHPKFILDAEQESDTDNFYVEIMTDGETEIITWSISQPNKEITDITINLESRRSYECKLYKVNITGQQFVVTGVTEPIKLTTRNSQRDVEKLMEKAVEFVQDHNVFEVKYLNREKPSTHPTIQESQKTGIMKKCLKDNNGDPYSSIINNIWCLHFSANPVKRTGDLANFSYFGDYRIKMVPEYLVEPVVDGVPERYNLYFADLFCINYNNNHWVTLVLTKPGSDEDKFCQNRLVKLDINKNPFFFKSGDGYKVTFVFCEILYTEDINLVEMRQKEGFEEENDIPLRGYGSSTRGMSKNPECEVCNLLPRD